jgi:hypothetical protein
VSLTGAFITVIIPVAHKRIESPAFGGPTVSMKHLRWSSPRSGNELAPEKVVKKQNWGIMVWIRFGTGPEPRFEGEALHNGVCPETSGASWSESEGFRRRPLILASDLRSSVFILRNLFFCKVWKLVLWQEIKLIMVTVFI